MEAVFNDIHSLGDFVSSSTPCLHPVCSSGAGSLLSLIYMPGGVCRNSGMEFVCVGTVNLVIAYILSGNNWMVVCTVIYIWWFLYV